MYTVPGIYMLRMNLLFLFTRTYKMHFNFYFLCIKVIDH